MSCAKDPLRVDRNRPPSTYLVGAPAESASSSYRIHLYWRGEDPDGYISGFLWSWDDSTVGAFRFTTRTDSIFELAVNDSSALVGGTGQQQPGQTKNHTFYIRAVDNLGKADPRFAEFNRRIYKASTQVPTVRFVGALPSAIPPTLDTLCDHTPFKVCWTGNDPDGWVNYYRWDVGVFSSGFSRDTCAVFNDPSDPGSITLVNGLYTFTVVAADNAFSLSSPAVGGRMQFVVNHDPETEILAVSANDTRGPVGYYRAPFLNGQVAPLPQDPPLPGWTPFYEGETIPYRSTVFFNWRGVDDPCDKVIGPNQELIPSGISGYAAVLSGTHNNNEPYITGFRNFLCLDANGDTIRFVSNDPGKVSGDCGFTELVLDSLDAMTNALFSVSSRDQSGRSDGTPASFRFSVNLVPHVSDLTVEDAPAPNSPPSKVFRWVGVDPEDGYTGAVVFHLDDIVTDRRRATAGTPLQSVTIPESTFRGLAPSNPHKLTVQVEDRAGALSPEILTITFDITETIP